MLIKYKNLEVFYTALNDLLKHASLKFNLENLKDIKYTILPARFRVEAINIPDVEQPNITLMVDLEKKLAIICNCSHCRSQHEEINKNFDDMIRNEKFIYAIDSDFNIVKHENKYAESKK